MIKANLFKQTLFLLCLTPILGGGRLNAQNLLTNGTFENPKFNNALTYLQPGSTVLTGWTVVGGEIHVNNDNYINLPAFEGDQYPEITGNYGYGKGILSDPISTIPGQLYELSFDIGAFYFGGSYGNAAVDVSFNEIQAGTLINFNTLTANGTDWEKVSIAYQATMPTTRIRLTGSQAGKDWGIGIDDIRFIQTQSKQNSGLASVPAPLPIFGCGGALAYARKLRRIQRSKIAQ
jgi:hypothetical protein